MIKHFAQLVEFRELLWALTNREIKVRYKQTILGTAWAVIQPLSLMIMFTLIFGFFLKINSNGLPYPLFYYSALLPWTFFATSLTFGSLAIINNGNLITKIYFPRETLPFASLIAAFFDFLVASIIFVLMLLMYKVPLTLNFVYVVPIIFLEVIFISGAVLFTSALNVMWRDIKFVIPLLVQLWIFVTPVIYPISKVPQNLKLYYLLNPMAPIVDNFRKVTVEGQTPDWGELGLAAIISLIVFLLSYIFFKSREKVFADII